MIQFGKSGWHGVISDEITFENIAIVAQAAADYLNDSGAGDSVVLGYDTRFLSREYAWAIQRVLTGNGIRVFLHKKPVPASFLSFSVPLCQAALGIMVTGEGRPARYSGLTFRLGRGEPVNDLWMTGLFNYLYRRYPRSSDETRQLLQYIDVYKEYSEHIARYLDLPLIRKQSPTVTGDSFFGSTGTYVQELLASAGIDSTFMRTKPNPGFMDSIPQPNDRNMQPLSKLVIQKKADIGIFFNSDGSQIGIMDSKGSIVPPSWVSAISLNEWLHIMGMDYEVYTELFTPGIAVPMLSGHNLGSGHLTRLHEEGRDLSKAVIWDRSSVIFGGFIPERDGIIQSLLVLHALCRHKKNWQKTLHEVRVIAGNRIMEQKSVNMDANEWSKKKKAILCEEAAFLKEHECRIINIEEDLDMKLWLDDGSWLGFSHNEKESSLSVYYDTPGLDDSDKFLSSAINWLLQF